MAFNRYQKILIFLWAVGIILWIGGSIVRVSIVYDIFEPRINSISFRYWVTKDFALWTVRHYSIGSLYTGIGFILALVSSIGLFPSMKKKFKFEGWLLMSYLLFFLAVLSELFLLYCDIRLGLYVFFEHNLDYSSNEVQTFFHNRFAKLNFLMVYNWLAIFTILFLFVFQPLKKKQNEEQSNL